MGKIHFNLDGVQTACKKYLAEHDFDITEDIKEVTCGNCIMQWNSLKNKWEKELKKEQKERNADL